MIDPGRIIFNQRHVTMTSQVEFTLSVTGHETGHSERFHYISLQGHFVSPAAPSALPGTP